MKIKWVRLQDCDVTGSCTKPAVLTPKPESTYSQNHDSDCQFEGEMSSCSCAVGANLCLFEDYMDSGSGETIRTDSDIQ